MSDQWKKTRLPQYDPPEEVWQRIQQRLQREEAPWQSLLHQLPQYDPPEAVWHEIQAQLRRATQSRRRRTLWRSIGAAAASVALVWLALHTRTNTQLPEIRWSTEVIDEVGTLPKGARSEEEALEEVLRICDHYPFLCADEEVQHLKAELQEVAAAKRRLGARLTQWDTEPELLKIFIKLEREEAQLIKQLVAVLQ